MKTPLLFSLCLMAAEAFAADFPSELYMLGSDGDSAEIPQTETAGVYETEIIVSMPSFSICALAAGTDSIVADYRPVGESTIYGGGTYPVAAGAKTDAGFSLAGVRMESDRLISVGDRVLVRVELDATASAGTFTMLKVESEATDCRELGCPAESAHRFSLSGLPASTRSRGLLIERLPDGTTRKIMR